MAYYITLDNNSSLLIEMVRSLEYGERTNGSRLDHVADGESLDRLILGCASRAVAAADGLDVATALLVSAAVEEKKEVSLLMFLSMVIDISYRMIVIR